MADSNDLIFTSNTANLVFEHLYTIGGYLTFAVKVGSNGFSGATAFCLPKKDVKHAINVLNNMARMMQGECKIKDTESASFLHIDFAGRHLVVTGQLGNDFDDHFLKFTFLADQTFVNLLEMKLRYSL